MTQLLPKKNPKKLIFESSLFNYSEKWLQITWKCENWKWPLVSLTSIFTASTWSIIKSRDSFEILRTCRFKNWPYFLNLVKIWGSYCQKTKKKKFWETPFRLEYFVKWHKSHHICIAYVSLNDSQKFPPLPKYQHDSCLNIFQLLELASKTKPMTRHI